jgi:hypothetical protein
MDKAIWFWIIYVVSVLFYGALAWPFDRTKASVFVVFVLIFLLGLGIFGSPIK